MRGVAYARQLSRRIFQRTGARDHTRYEKSDYGYVEFDGEGFAIRGGNHLAGTHVMGSSPHDSVVNDKQRSWDHENLYLVGGGSLASVGTGNITLTVAALCFRSVRHMLTQLERETAPAAVAVN
jgi:choline dehydrogenase-like flavoprotein